jgi:hypothetical protein
VAFFGSLILRNPSSLVMMCICARLVSWFEGVVDDPDVDVDIAAVVFRCIVAGRGENMKIVEVASTRQQQKGFVLRRETYRG